MLAASLSQKVVGGGVWRSLAMALAACGSVKHIARFFAFAMRDFSMGNQGQRCGPRGHAGSAESCVDAARCHAQVGHGTVRCFSILFALRRLSRARVVRLESSAKMANATRFCERDFWGPQNRPLVGETRLGADESDRAAIDTKDNTSGD